MTRKKHEQRRYAQDVMGMPVFAADEKFTALIAAESMVGAVAKDDENCAIALGCKRQLQSPYASIGRSRSDIAMPHPQGVRKPGYGNTKWAVIRFANSQKAKDIIVAADTEALTDEGVVVTLLPAHRSDYPGPRREMNRRLNKQKQANKKRDTADELTLMGVRTLTGQRKR